MKSDLLIIIKYLDVAPLVESFDRNLLANDIFEVDFGGSYKLQIENNGGDFKVINAVDWGGNNRKEQFKDAKVIFTSLEKPTPHSI